MMKKKFLFATFLVAILLVMSFSLAMANSGQVNLEGDNPAVDGDGDEKDGDKGGAYCSDKKDGYHPIVSYLATVFGDDLGVDEEDINELFCQGYSVGQIALALQTEKVYKDFDESLVCDEEDEGSEGEDSGNEGEDEENECIDYNTLLERREDGEGWGQIWKDLKDNGLKHKGAEKPVPPGQAKKQTESDDETEEPETEPESNDENKTKPESGKAKGKNKGDDHPSMNKENKSNKNK